MAASGSGTQPTLSALAKYVLLLVALATSVVVTYLLHILPEYVGFAGAGTSLAGLFAFATADLEANADPSPIPTGTTFVVITVAAGIMGAVGVYTSQTFATWTAFIAWLLLVIEYVLTTFRSQLDNYVPSAYDSWIVAGLGIVVSLIQYLAANPGASLSSLVVTGAVALASYLNNSGSTPAAAGAAPTPT
jgi:hypothetical protein